jgi:hypothetical protein
LSLEGLGKGVVAVAAMVAMSVVVLVDEVLGWEEWGEPTYLAEGNVTSLLTK